MPRILDLYLLKQFMQVLVICFCSMAGLYVVIDAFGHLDHFVDFANENGNLLIILAEYYGYRTLEFFDRTSGLLALIGAMFTVTWIERHQEMVALLAAGIPRFRILLPILIAAIGISLLAAANRELVMPNVRHKLALDSKNLGGDKSADLQPSFDRETSILLAGEKVVHKGKIIQHPNFVMPNKLTTYGKQISAQQAQYFSAQPDRPSGYLFSGVKSPKILLTAPSLELNGQPVVITPQDDPELEHDQVFIVSGVSFEFLAAGSTWRNFASTGELVRELRSPSTDLGAGVRVAVHNRLIRPFLDATLLFLGLPLIVSRANRNPFVAIGLCLAVVTIFMVVVIGCQSLGSSGWMQPALAAWLPLMIFGPVAISLFDPLRT
jgi:lipopolysaccharide export system permease protein